LPDFAELFNNMQEQKMQEFMIHSKAFEFVKLCTRDIAAGRSSRAKQPTPGLASKWCKPHLLTYRTG
jgi:hypothetical protein